MEAIFEAFPVHKRNEQYWCDDVLLVHNWSQTDWRERSEKIGEDFGNCSNSKFSVKSEAEISDGENFQADIRCGHQNCDGTPAKIVSPKKRNCRSRRFGKEEGAKEIAFLFWAFIR
ncbi:hypothetical protein U1Q18_034836 [Sarracenia purpurea var. burkii]